MSTDIAPRGRSSPNAQAIVQPSRRLVRLWLLCTYDLSGLARFARQRKTVILPPGIKNIHLFHVRKTAGTSLYNAFLSLGGDDPRVVLRNISKGYPWFAYSGGYTFAANYHPNRLVNPVFSFSHDPFWSFETSIKTYKITILRDPVARVISLYRYLSDARSDEQEVYPAAPHEHDLVGYGLPSFFRNLPKEDLLFQLYMFSRGLSPNEAAANIRSCHCYFFTEDYGRGIKHLSHQLGVNLLPRHDRGSKGNAPATNVAELRRMLEPEYEMLRLLMTDPGPGFVGTFPLTIAEDL
jgi:hypothetical protein